MIKRRLRSAAAVLLFLSLAGFLDFDGIEESTIIIIPPLFAIEPKGRDLVSK